MQRVLVTGANRGLGLEFVRQLLARGDRVIATCRHPGRANELTAQAAAHPGHLHVLPLDVGKDASIVELAREAQMLFDGLDVLISNAGVLVSGERYGSLTAEDMESSFRSNAVGPVLLAQALTPLLASGRNPRIAHLSSVMGSIASTDAFRSPSYGMTKAALNMATVQLAHALAPQGVLCVALHPGWVRTDMGGPNAMIDPDEAVRGMLGVIDGLKARDSGSFRDYQGKTLPW
jgi:NAD(P)-dependent dehydrogenase (short-subunit alcohol dehydrogenase family)